jgi:hypothetical protein
LSQVRRLTNADSDWARKAREWEREREYFMQQQQGAAASSFSSSAASSSVRSDCARTRPAPLGKHRGVPVGMQSAHGGKENNTA